MKDPFDTVEALEKSHQKLISLLEKHLANPANVTVDSGEVAKVIALKLPNFSGIIEEVRKERQAAELAIKSIPTTVEVKGSFYGFTSQQSFFTYWLTMVFTISICSYVAFRSTDDERVNQFKQQVESFRQNNPKVADKYFGNWYQRNIGSKF